MSHLLKSSTPSPSTFLKDVRRSMCNSKKTHEKCPIDGSILNEREAVAITLDDGVLNYQFQCTVVYVFGQIYRHQKIPKVVVTNIFESNNPSTVFKQAMTLLPLPVNTVFFDIRTIAGPSIHTWIKTYRI